jgi:hypothetical protein
MSLNERKNKHTRFWATFRKVNLVGPKSLGLNYKKKIWKRFLFSSALWKKRAFFCTAKNKFSSFVGSVENSLKAYVFI